MLRALVQLQQERVWLAALTCWLHAGPVLLQSPLAEALAARQQHMSALTAQLQHHVGPRLPR